MISFDTFTGDLHDSGAQSPSSSSCGGDTCASDSGAEMQQRSRRRMPADRLTTALDAQHDGVALADYSAYTDDSSGAEFEDVRSEDSGESTDAAARYDLFHERTHTRSTRSSRRSRKHRKASASLLSPSTINTSNAQQQQQQGDHTAPESGSRVLQLFHLLSLKNHASDAKSALVQRLVAVTNVKDLVMSKATEEQIASAANDAITDEILASVDREDKRRQSVTGLLATGQRTPSLTEATLDAALADTASSSALVSAGHYSPYRVLELVDVLDSTTGGMVKLILTNVRNRAPFAQRPLKDTAIEFCGFCAAYSDHTAAQHRCRICGAAGQHRSKACPTSASSSPSARTPPLQPKSTTSMHNGSPSGKAYCAFCAAVVHHTTQTHQCRNCGALGAHRSRSCNSSNSKTKAAASSRSSRWVGSPIEQLREHKFCDLCNAWRRHMSHEHKCSICAIVGEHRSKNCPMKAVSKPGALTTTAASGSCTPRSDAGHRGTPTPLFCSFCAKKAAHRSEDHRCRVCLAVGAHRSGDCPERKQPQSVLSYSVTTASKVFEKVLPASATSLVMDSIDKVGDVDTILKKTLQRIGVWGGGSQTPITTPYAPPVVAGSSTASSYVSVSVANAAGVYVLSYAEGRSVVPERILKYMRLLMHHEISVNAFSVVVRFDPRSSHWELEKPGMVTPRSLPSSPTMSEQLKKRMATYTLQTLLDARQKLVAMALLQRKQELLLQQHERQQQLAALAAEAPESASAVTVHSS